MVRPPLIDVWPFPGIPSPHDWLESGARMVADAQTAEMRQSIQLILNYSTPSLQLITSDWFSYIQGRWLGTAINLMNVVIVVVHLLVMLHPSAESGRRIGKVWVSALVLALEIRLFYPVYGLAVTLSHKASEGIIQIMVGNMSKHELLMEVLRQTTPASVLALLGSSVVGVIMQFLVMSTVFAMVVLTLGNIIIWPWALALRVVSKFFGRCFSLCNGFVTMAFVAPPFMIFWLCLGIVVTRKAGQIVPVPGVAGFAAFFIQQIVALLIVATPVAIVFFTYRASNEVFGRIDSAVEGSIDVRASQPLDVQHVQQNNQQAHGSFIGELLPAVAIATVDDKPGEPFSRRLADIAATTATASHHPVVAMSAEVVKRSISDQPTAKDGET